MTNRALPILTAVSAAALLSACAVGPKAPDAALPPAASGAFIGAANPAVTAQTAARDDWWRLFNDPVLDGLIAQALAENNDLKKEYVSAQSDCRAKDVTTNRYSRRRPDVGVSSR